MYLPSFHKNVARSQGKPLATADARGLRFITIDNDPGPDTYVTAILSSFSYRNHPFYSRLAPDGAGTGWSYTDDDALEGEEWTLEFTKPGIKAEFMCPPFKAHRQLGDRAIIADTFDYAPEGGGAFTQGLAAYHHKGGYNVAYGDGHVAWFDDEDGAIANWKDEDWADTANPGTDNLTISSMSAQRVWNQFDQAAGIDKP